MRGADYQQSGMFSYISAERRVPEDHPLRAIRAIVDVTLRNMGAQFDAMYAQVGRPSIAPEKLLRALLLQVLYTVRSERMLMEQLNYNLLFRWFVGMNIDDPVWDVTVFTKNRERLLAGGVASTLFAEVLAQARSRALLSSEHFTVDGTLIEAWAGHKSFKRKDGSDQRPPDDPGNPTVDFHGERRSNATHQSTTDPEARLAKKGAGKEAKLSFAGHVLMENRNGLAVNGCVTLAKGRAEVEAAVAMVEEIPGQHRVTVGGDKAYDTKEFVQEMRDHQVTPHVALKATTIIDARTTRHSGYAISQQKRKRVEEIFGWLKTVGGLRKARHRGVARVGWMFTFALAAYNLVRMRNLAAAAASLRPLREQGGKGGIRTLKMLICHN
jgi:transposase